MPSWLSDLVGTEMAPLAYYALVAAIVLVLIVIVLAIAKRAMGVGSGPKVKGRGPRLAVLDVSIVDPKRKLVLVRRDEVEHLLLIGGQNDLVVEAGIHRNLAGTRAGRPEPSLGVESDVVQGGLQRQPMRTAAPTQRQPSPLTRPVPRPAPAPASEPASAPIDASRRVGASAEVMAVVPPVASPTLDPMEPAMEVSRPALPMVAPRVELPTSAPREERLPEAKHRPIETAQPIPAVESPSSSDATPEEAKEPKAPVVTVAPVAPIAPQPPRVPAPVSPAPTASPAAPAPVADAPIVPPVFPAAQTPVPVPQVQAPAPQASQVQAQGPTPPAPRTQPIPASVLPRPISREPERAQPASSSPTDPATENKKPAIPVLPPRFSVGGTLEPVQRSGPPTPMQPFQPRSMATPTLPAKPSTGAAELEAKAERPVPPQPAASMPTPSRTQTQPEVASPTAEPIAAPVVREQDIETRGKVSPEPSPEAVLARLLAKAKEPVRTGPVTAQIAEPPLGRSGDGSASDAVQRLASPEPLVPSVSAPDAGDRRPLSVRSFASTIQGRQPTTEAPATSQPPQRREPEIEVPSVPTPPAVSPPVAAPAPAAPASQPATTWEDEEDDLEDFLSAQLNDQLGEDIWTAKESEADAPAVESEKPTPSQQPSVETARAAPTPKRPLTLEEEMERLLGDFDLETSDRRGR